MIMDPTTLLLYKTALAAIILLCGVGAIYGVSKIGSASGISGIKGFVAWAITDGKSYALAIVGFVATAAYGLNYITWDRWTVIMGLVNGTAIATLRATQGKTIEQVKTAAAAADEAAAIAANTQQTVVRAVVKNGAPLAPPVTPGPPPSFVPPVPPVVPPSPFRAP